VNPSALGQLDFHGHGEPIHRSGHPTGNGALQRLRTVLGRARGCRGTATLTTLQGWGRMHSITTVLRQHASSPSHFTVLCQTVNKAASLHVVVSSNMACESVEAAVTPFTAR